MGGESATIRNSCQFVDKCRCMSHDSNSMTYPLSRRLCHGLALTVFVLPLMLGCDHPVTEQLEGRWFGESLDNVDTEQLSVATAWVRGTSFEFAGSSVTVTIPREEPRTGEYKVVSARKNDVTVAIASAPGRSDTASFTLDSPRYMRWHIGDGRAVVLRRER